MLMGFWGSVIRCSSPDSALLETLGRRPVEPVFRKTTYDGFHGTGLEDWFREKGVRQLLAVGFLTHLCVETTVRSAFVRGLQPLVAADATATVSEEMHVASLRAMHHGFAGVLSSQAVLKELGGS
jgi:nicotinamidase-related amidase